MSVKEKSKIITARKNRSIRIINGKVVKIDRICRTSKDLEVYRQELLREMEKLEDVKPNV